MSDEKPVSLIGTIHIPIKVQGKDKEYHCQITAPGPMAPVDELQKALLRNRELLDKSQNDLKDTLRKEYFGQVAPWLLNYDGPIQNALTARFNINVLIPLINIKGGVAEFDKFEAMPVKQHVEKMLAKAEKAVLMEELDNLKPFHYIFTTAVVLAAFFILLFVGLNGD